jgi:PAS domain S-box-containing protein
MEGVCTFCNPAALRLLGYDQAEEILGKNIHTLMHPTRRDGSAYPEQEWPIMASLQGGEDAHIVEETVTTE